MTERKVAINTILRLPQVKARTGLSRSTIYVRIADGSFPPPVRLGLRAVGWLEEQIDAWITRQVDLTEAERRVRKHEPATVRF
jgi:prophage regulatory protein